MSGYSIWVFIPTGKYYVPLFQWDQELPILDPVAWVITFKLYGEGIRVSQAVAEPPELSRLKCAGHHHKGNTSSNALQTEQLLVYRVTSRYNHRFSDRTSIPRTKASPEILQPQFYNTGIVKITNQFKSLLQNQT